MPSDHITFNCAGITIPISPDCDFFADAAVELWNHYTNANATIGIKISY